MKVMDEQRKMEIFQIDRERAYFPTVSWEFSTPEQQGMDSNLLFIACKSIEKAGVHLQRYSF